MDAGPVSRIEAQPLAALRQHGFQFRHRRGGRDGAEQFFRLVIDDARQRRDSELRQRPGWRADTAAGATGDDLERRFYRTLLAHEIDDLRFGLGFSHQ